VRQHWPAAFQRGENTFPGEKGDTDYVDTWKAMEKLYRSGKARAIGISNFSRAELKRLLQHASVVPAAHQMELHPWLQQTDFVKFNQSKGIHVTAYSPFGNLNPAYGKGGDLLINEPALVEIGKKYGKTGPQTALAWGIAKGFSVIPKSKTESRIKANYEGDFKLTADEVKKIDALDKKLRMSDPSAIFGWNFYADLDGKEIKASL
jgi:alcohol dehydrogenase (NADP+)